MFLNDTPTDESNFSDFMKRSYVCRLLDSGMMYLIMSYEQTPGNWIIEFYNPLQNIMSIDRFYDILIKLLADNRSITLRVDNFYVDD